MGGGVQYDTRCQKPLIGAGPWCAISSSRLEEVVQRSLANLKEMSTILNAKARKMRLV